MTFKTDKGFFVVGWVWQSQDDPDLYLHVRGEASNPRPAEDNKIDFDNGCSAWLATHIEGKHKIIKIVSLEKATQLLTLLKWQRVKGN